MEFTELAPSPAESRELMRYDLTVRRLIYRAAANPHLEDMLVRYDNLATRICCLVLDKVPSVSGHITEHVELLKAVAEGHADKAGELALHHVTSFEETIRNVLLADPCAEVAGNLRARRKLPGTPHVPGDLDDGGRSPPSSAPAIVHDVLGAGSPASISEEASRLRRTVGASSLSLFSSSASAT